MREQDYVYERLKEWREKEIVTNDVYDAIVAYEKKQEKERTSPYDVPWLLIAASIMLVCALFFFVASNWDTWSDMTRLFLGIGLLTASYAGYAWSEYTSRESWVTFFATLAIGIFGANLVIIGQIYTLPTFPYISYLLWGLSSFALAWIVKRTVVTWTQTIVWLVIGMMMVNEPMYLWNIGIALLAFGVTTVLVTRIPSKSYRYIYGLFSILVGLFVVQNIGMYEFDGMFNGYAPFVVWVLALVVAAQRFSVLSSVPFYAQFLLWMLLFTGWLSGGISYGEFLFTESPIVSNGLIASVILLFVLYDGWKLYNKKTKISSSFLLSFGLAVTSFLPFTSLPIGQLYNVATDEQMIMTIISYIYMFILLAHVYLFFNEAHESRNKFKITISIVLFVIVLVASLFNTSIALWFKALIFLTFGVWMIIRSRKGGKGNDKGIPS